METLKNIWNTQKFLIGLIIGLVVGLGAGFIMFDRGDASSKKMVAKEEGLETEEVGASSVVSTSGVRAESVAVSGENAVAVNDQPAGDVVSVTMATLSQSGWVVVHEEGEVGMPGRVLGAHRYDAGIYLAEVELLKPTEAGKTYYVELYADNGDRQFSLENDGPMTDANGKAIMATFKAQ